MPGPLPGLDGAGPDRVREGAAALHAPPPARVGAYLLYCIVNEGLQGCNVGTGISESSVLRSWSITLKSVHYSLKNNLIELT